MNGEMLIMWSSGAILLLMCGWRKQSEAEWFYSVSRLRAARDASHTESCDRGMNEWMKDRERSDVWSENRSGVVWVQAEETCTPVQLCTLKKQLHAIQHTLLLKSQILSFSLSRWKCHICSIKSNHHTHASEQRSEADTCAFCIRH